MKAGQHEESTPKTDSKVPQAWVREPDQPKEDHTGHTPAARDEAQSLDEPGYGYGV
jgi:hypothetical protein